MNSGEARGNSNMVIFRPYAGFCNLFWIIFGSRKWYITVNCVKLEVFLSMFLLREYLSEDQHWHCDKTSSYTWCLLCTVGSRSPQASTDGSEHLESNHKPGVHYTCINHTVYWEVVLIICSKWQLLKKGLKLSKRMMICLFWIKWFDAVKLDK